MAQHCQRVWRSGWVGLSDWVGGWLSAMVGWVEATWVCGWMNGWLYGRVAAGGN